MQQKLRQVYVLCCCKQFNHAVLWLVVLWTAVLLYERGSYTVSGRTPAAGTEKKISVTQNLLHECQVWWGMYCSSMMYSS